jgi:cytochrome c
MGGMEFNKIFAAILVAGIIAMFSGFLAEKFVHPEKLKENAFAIEGVEEAGGGAPVEKLAEPILAMIAEADVARGQKISKACAACHSFDKGGPNGVGPNLWNVVGAKKQAVPGFTYSGVLNAQGEDYWTYAALNKYLWKPKKYAPGTKMNYVGIKKPEDRAAMVAWLRTLADNPKPFPGALAIAEEEAELALPENESTDAKDAIDTIKEGVKAEQQSIDDKKSQIKKLESDVDQTEKLIDRKQKDIEKAKDVVKGVVKGAKE